MKICLQCQTEYDDTKKFCRHDGSLLEDGESGTAKANELICPQCNNPIEAGKKFCRHCGARLGTGLHPPVVRVTPAFLAEEQNCPDPSAENLAIAQKHYAQGEYKEAIAHVEQLLVQEPDNRLYQLYWLLSQVKAYGLDGYESGVAELLQWQQLTQTEKPLARELLMLAGGACLQQGDLAAAEQRLLRAHHLSPSQDVARLLAMSEGKKGDAAQQAGDFEQALAHYQRAAVYDPEDQTLSQKLTQLALLRVQKRQQKRQDRRKKLVRGISLGAAVVLLIGSGTFGYRKIQDWLQPPPSQLEVATAPRQELAEAQEPGHTPPPQTELVSPTPSEPAENPLGEAKPPEQEKTADTPPVAESPARPFPSEEVMQFTPPANIPAQAPPPPEKPQARPEEPKRVAKATERHHRGFL